MKVRSTFWLSASTLFTLANAAGMGFAIDRSEAAHAATHAGLMVIGVFLVWLIDARSRRPDVTSLPVADERLAQLQQSIDAVALEVERIGESQRFKEKQGIEREQPRR